MLQSNLFLWGFHSKTFRFWNETTGELIFEHNCGGANRIWDFYLPPGTESSSPLDTTSLNGETRLIPNTLSGTKESSPIRDVTQGAWLMYTSKSEVTPLYISLSDKSCISANQEPELSTNPSKKAITAVKSDVFYPSRHFHLQQTSSPPAAKTHTLTSPKVPLPLIVCLLRQPCSIC